MHSALSVPRVHIPKNHITAVYDPATNGAWVDRAKGVHFRTMGHGVQSRVWLTAEESLFMLERGSLSIAYPRDESDSTDPSLAVPMSLQGAYAAFIRTDLSLERYVVYAALRRSGYAVFRGSGWSGPEDHFDKPPEKTSSMTAGFWRIGLFQEIWQKFLCQFSNDAKANGPLVPPNTYRSYGEEPCCTVNGQGLLNLFDS